MGSQHSTVRRVVTVVAAVSLLAVPTIAVTASPAAAASAVQLEGRGWGHGRGLGQYGALGYAIDHGWPASQILDHFYGNTTAGHMPENAIVRVRLLAHDGKPMIVRSAAGVTSNPGGAAPQGYLRIDRLSSNVFRLHDGPSCTGPWTARGDVSGPVVVTAAGSAPAGGPERDQLLQLCELHGDGSHRITRWYRGTLSMLDTSFGTRVVNELPMEQYLRGVVPRESPASWGDLGGGKGMEALRAQAVAARSYAAAEGRYDYAQTCDTISCQVYLGHAEQPAGGSVKVLEDGRTDAAISGTARIVRMRDGKSARTEFSSSTGGFTAGGVFPAVPDDGDDVANNPNHRWGHDVSFASIEPKYGKGSLWAVDVVEQNGLGEDGGRVLRMRLRFQNGDVTLSGDDFRRAFGLKSNWFRVVNLGPPDSRTKPAGGYVLRADGTLTPFGTAAAVDPVALAEGTARAVAIGGASGAAGYVLDGYGQLHPVGGAALVADGTPRWAGWDIARDVVLRKDGVSGYILDGWGGIHGFGGAPKPAIQSGGYQQNSDSARHLLLRANGTSGYLVKQNGTVFAFGGAPAVSVTALPSGRVAAGALLHPAGDRGYVIDDSGAARPFGASSKPPTISGPGVSTAAVGGRLDGRSGYAATPDGQIRGFGGAIESVVEVSAAAAGAVRDLALVPEPAGYTLDGFGGLHAFGGAPRVTKQSYFAGRDVARRVAMLPNSSGFVIDEYGEFFPFGTEAAPPPAKPWEGRRLSRPLMRDLVLIPGTSKGYVLDGWGGLHAFGGAPPARGGPYWPGWDIATGVAVNPAGTGGFVLDAWGGIHRFAVGSNPLPPAVKASAYWQGWKIVRDVVMTGDAQGYTLDGFGGMHPFGGQTGKGSWYWLGRDLAAATASDGTDRGWAVYLDRWGGLHTAGPRAPLVVPSKTWPQWSIARDVGLIPR